MEYYLIEGIKKENQTIDKYIMLATNENLNKLNDLFKVFSKYYFETKDNEKQIIKTCDYKPNYIGKSFYEVFMYIQSLITTENLEHCFNKDVLIKKIDNLEFYFDEDNNQRATLQVLCNGSHGQYIPQIVCKMFGLIECNSPDNENYYGDFDWVENQLNNLINDYFNLHNYHFYLCYNSNDGDYELQVIKIDNSDNINED